MSVVILRGADAINYAEAHNLPLSLAAPGDGAQRHNITPDEAWAFIGDNDPDLISIEIEAEPPAATDSA